jgi:hypothetical protein
MEWFVFHEDDYPDNGGIGLHKCANAKVAQRFIEGRIAEDPIGRTLDKYTVIEGKEHELIEINMITKVGIV